MRTFVDLGTFIIDIITLPMLLSAVFERRVKPMSFWISFVVIAPIYYWVLTGFSWSNIWYKFPILLAWCAVTAAFYQGFILYRACVTAVYLIILVTLDNFVFGLAIALSGHTFQDLQANYNLSAFFAVITHIILLTVCFILARLLASRKGKIHLPGWEWVTILFITGFTIISLYFFIFTLTDESVAGSTFPLQAVVVPVMLLLLNAGILLLLNKFAAQYRIETENRALQE